MMGDERSEPPRLSVGRRARMLLGWGVLLLLAVLTARSLEWRRVFEAMRTANVGWLAAAVIANTGILIFWAGFWRALLPRGEEVAYWCMFRIASIASAIMNTVPLLAGHASSLVLLVRRGGTTRHGALSVLALDQLGEGLAKVFVFLLVAIITPIPAAMRAGIVTASTAVGVLLVVLVTLAHRYRLSPANPPADPRADPSLAARVGAFAERWAHALDALRSGRRSAAALALVLATKAAEALGIIAVQRSFGVEVSITGTLLVLAAVMLATMIPLAPGNLGTYEASVFFAYDYLGISPATALALALVQHACFMLPAVGVGYALLMLDARSVIASE
jgi:uncharacterized membrane protein YbhN (UPF0104 family)